MDDQQHEHFLKNIAAFSIISGQLTPQEERLLGEIRLQIGAKKSVLNRAIKAASEHEISHGSIRRFSDRVRNLESMIEMAYADGRLEDAEKSPLGRFARQIGLTQDILNLMAKESRERQRAVPDKCAACGVQVAEGAKFCPGCGIELATATAAATKIVELPIVAHGVTIAFADSSSAAFPIILQLARKQTTYAVVDRGGKRWHAVSFLKSECQVYLELVEQLTSLRNREVYVDGQITDWGDVFGFAHCASQRTKSYRPVEYCFGLDDDRLNVWACKQIRMDWTSWSDLFTCGRFQTKTKFVFDMGRLRHDITTRAECVGLCPHLRQDFIKAMLECWPPHVSVGPRTGWGYRRSYQTDPRAIKIKIVEQEDGFSFTDEFYTNGVEPEDPKIPMKLIDAALKRCTQADINVKRLVAGK